MEDKKIKVYVKVDEFNRIIDINSSIFIENVENWIFIDEGFGDKYAHAQGNYFDKPITDEYGIYQYKLVDSEVIERSADEMLKDYVYNQEQSTPSQLDRIEQAILAKNKEIAQNAIDEYTLELLQGGII